MVAGVCRYGLFKRCTFAPVARQLLVQGRLCLVAQLVHQDPAPVRCDQHFGGAGFAVPVRILARLVDVEGMVGVLDQRNLQPLRNKTGNEFLDQCGLATTGPAGETECLHCREACTAPWPGR